MIDVNRFCPGCMGEATGDRYCDICGYDNLSKNPVEALNVKFLLNNRYIIGTVIDQSSESITYIAFDSEKNITVDIKEYFPLNMSVRYPDKTVAAKTKENNYYFNEGLLEFIELNRKIARLENISVFNITSIFEENGTAYTVMSHNTGITLSNFLERNGGVLKWEQARPLFLPLFDTVATLNENGIIHGGISPESISVGRDGKLRLTNISIIKTRFASENFATAIYPGCAAIEQYSTEKGNIGTFTDVYGLASTLFRVIMGSLPPAANERLNNDKMSISSSIAADLPRQVLVALANGLQVKIGDRTKSVEQFRDEIVYGETPENIQKADAKRRKAAEQEDSQSAVIAKTGGQSSNKKNSKKGNSSVKYAVISALCTVILVVALVFGVFGSKLFKNKDDKKEKTVSSETTTSQESEEDSKPIYPDEKTYPVPDLAGKYYSELKKLPDCDYFKISISGKTFSNTVPRGAICSQSVEAGKQLTRDSQINIVISLGPKSFRMANVVGQTRDKALIDLLKQGFLYNNIEVLEKEDPDSKPDVVLKQDPKPGEELTSDDSVTIYVNSYVPPAETQEATDFNYE